MRAPWQMLLVKKLNRGFALGRGERDYADQHFGHDVYKYLADLVTTVHN